MTTDMGSPGGIDLPALSLTHAVFFEATAFGVVWKQE